MERIGRYSDILFAVAVILILAVMVIPVPPFLMDVLLTLNIALTLVILLMTLYVTRPLELSVFPGLLLVITLFRLSLNVASTRLVLGQGYAGQVIQAFGTFVVRGDYVLGLVIFLIIVIIQFVVITKGAGRVAEVAARFTLDAMPGKQMSIDADLNAGLINDEEARRRRREISREADFYGAMDGASKFVRGDAVAGILIVLVNIVGGFAIGVLKRGMTLSEAAQTYTLLTIGDGLVTQIPALIASTASGILVTRAASEADLGRDLTRELTARPRAIMVTAAVLFALALVPGLPAIPFLILSALSGTVAYATSRAQQSAAQETQAKTEAAEKKTPEEKVEDYLHVDPLEVEIGYGLIPLVDPQQGGNLLDRVTMIRKQTALDLGIVVPPVRIRDNIQLKPSAYVIRIRGVKVSEGELQVKGYMAIDPGYAEGPIEGIEATDPAFGLPVRWITEANRERAELLGYNVVGPDDVLATHLTEVIRSHAHEILGRQNVQALIDGVKKDYPAVVGELIPDQISLGGVQKILQNLLKERVPIRDMVTVLETTADYAPITKDPEILAEYVRTALGRTICQLYQTPEGTLPALTVSPKVEGLISESIQNTVAGIKVALAPDLARRLFERMAGLIDGMVSNGQQPLVLTAPTIRLAFRRLTETTFPSLTVLSYNEIVPGIEVFSVGMVDLENGE
ncbi:MAG: flagellar biosynthesis protein FlhA [Candidatus Handelsmanbacteria bacterium RIFCSPLOWO2_12_FULL_64_10]|uniref:Flagellar biosynthesis protein FlhA n=1 Tax=Handelsmanbacteria sp. (strain RIFCSPLOWO2_12_FULL_64_10) TaxID=1817868 RepID=A0A1F6D2M5_HANXR|nr:MAG: flagellar biosynthesis protein FlhA [Candidatus Handelsmanbacteria bacterium RIFCSPLOWO2_12_FULL_64_10]